MSQGDISNIRNSRSNSISNPHPVGSEDGGVGTLPAQNRTGRPPVGRGGRPRSASVDGFDVPRTEPYVQPHVTGKPAGQTPFTAADAKTRSDQLDDILGRRGDPRANGRGAPPPVQTPAPLPSLDPAKAAAAKVSVEKFDVMLKNRTLPSGKARSPEQMAELKKLNQERESAIKAYGDFNNDSAKMSDIESRLKTFNEKKAAYEKKTADGTATDQDKAGVEAAQRDLVEHPAFKEQAALEGRVKSATDNLNSAMARHQQIDVAMQQGDTLKYYGELEGVDKDEIASLQTLREKIAKNPHTVSSTEVEDYSSRVFNLEKGHVESHLNQWLNVTDTLGRHADIDKDKYNRLKNIQDKIKNNPSEVTGQDLMEYQKAFGDFQADPKTQKGLETLVKQGMLDNKAANEVDGGIAAMLGAGAGGAASDSAMGLSGLFTGSVGAAQQYAATAATMLGQSAMFNANLVTYNLSEMQQNTEQKIMSLNEGLWKAVSAAASMKIQ